MLFLTDDNDFRGDSQEITIDVSLPLPHALCNLLIHQWFDLAPRATWCSAGSQGGHPARMMSVLGG